MEDGRVVEEGTHAEFKARGGLSTRRAALQSGWRRRSQDRAGGHRPLEQLYPRIIRINGVASLR
jgi:hypothetical protein